MSDEVNKPGRFTLNTPVTLTFPNLDEPKAISKNGKAVGAAKYSANLEFTSDHPDLTAVKAEAAKVARAEWPGVDLKDVRFPFVNGAVLADKAAARSKNREFSRGKVVLTARSKYQPRLSQVANGRIVDVDGDQKPLVKKAFYHGVSALAQVSFSAYTQDDNDGIERKGVNAYLDLVLSLNKGDRLAGGASAAEVFKGYIGSTSDEDPTGASLDDDISF